MKRETRLQNIWEAQTGIAKPPKNQFFGGKMHHPELISEEALYGELLKSEHAKIVSQEITLLPIGESRKSKAAKKSRALLIYEFISSRVAQAIAWLSARQKKRMLTKKGETALQQLRMLSDIYLVTCAGDGLESVALQTAFGETYYHIAQASKERNSHAHAGRTPRGEDYGAYLEHFARSASNIA